MDWTKLPELLKMQTRYWFSASVVLGTILFVPESLASPLGIDSLRSTFHPYLGVAFIFSTVVFIVQSSISIFEWVQKKVKRMRIGRIVKKRLKQLSPDEKRRLCGYILADEKTQYFSIEDGVVSGLVQANIIYQASSIGNLYGKGFAYNIQPWVETYLKKHL